MILNAYDLSWMVNRFFFETLGVTYESIATTIRESWDGADEPPLGRIERVMYKARRLTLDSCWSVDSVFFVSYLIANHPACQSPVV